MVRQGYQRWLSDYFDDSTSSFLKPHNCPSLVTGCTKMPGPPAGHCLFQGPPLSQAGFKQGKHAIYVTTAMTHKRFFRCGRATCCTSGRIVATTRSWSVTMPNSYRPTDMSVPRPLWLPFWGSKFGNVSTEHLPYYLLSALKASFHVARKRTYLTYANTTLGVR